MLVLDRKYYEEAFVTLRSGVDYDTSDLMQDRLLAGDHKLIKHHKLVEIAKKHGFVSCSYSGHEKDGKVNAVFRKEITK